MSKICIDPGHGGKDPGALGIYAKESALNLQIAYNLELVLWENYIDSIMTRRRDRTLSPEARASFANRYRAGLFISIHCNASYDKTVTGVETFIFPGSKVARPFALRVQKSLIKQIPGHNNRGVKEADFKVLRLTRMPAILVECEFISNREQENYLSHHRNHYKIADAIYNGIEPLL